LPIKNIFNIINGEFENYDKSTIEELKCPNLSIIEWKRVIIDSFTVQTTFKNKYMLELLETIKSNHTWIQITNFPFLRAELLQLINLISGKEINYPLFNNDNSIYYINNLIRVISKDKEKNKMNKMVS
jgi:hypothetical protein